MIIFDSPMTQSLDRLIENKEWDKIEEALDDLNLQSYHPDKLAEIAMVLLEKLKEKSK